MTRFPSLIVTVLGSQEDKNSEELQIKALQTMQAEKRGFLVT